MGIVDMTVQHADREGFNASLLDCTRSSRSRSKSNGRSTSPLASDRSRTSITSLGQRRSFSIASENRSGRSCSPIRSTSANPAVTSKRGRCSAACQQRVGAARRAKPDVQGRQRIAKRNAQAEDVSPARGLRYRQPIRSRSLVARRRRLAALRSDPHEPIAKSSAKPSRSPCCEVTHRMFAATIRLKERNNRPDPKTVRLDPGSESSRSGPRINASFDRGANDPAAEHFGLAPRLRVTNEASVKVPPTSTQTLRVMDEQVTS